mgnify:FL=1
MEKNNVARTNLLSIQLKEKQGLSKVEIKKSRYSAKWKG